MAEYLIGSGKHTGLIKESIPELVEHDMPLKDFMINHVTAYWPCVFRTLANEWPAIVAWQNDAYLVDKLPLFQVSETKNGEITAPFQQEYKLPQMMKHSEYREGSSNLFLDDIILQQTLLEDV